MGEKGNIAEAAAAGQTVVERTTTVIGDASGEVTGVMKDETLKRAADATITGAVARARGKDDDDDETGEPEGDTTPA